MYRKPYYRKPYYKSTLSYQTIAQWSLFLVLFGVAILLMSIPGLQDRMYVLLIAIGGLGVITLAAAVPFLWFVRKRERERLRAVTVADIDHMTGVAFEHYTGRVLESRGFQIRYTKLSGDYGIDIIARRGQDTYGIQLKRYSYTVGRSAVSDAVAGVAYYKCNKAMVITSNYFTPNAKQLAAMNHCELVDRFTLSEWIREFQLQSHIK